MAAEPGGEKERQVRERRRVAGEAPADAPAAAARPAAALSDAADVTVNGPGVRTPVNNFEY